MLEGGSVVLLMVHVHLLYCSLFVDFIMLIDRLLVDVQVLDSSIVVDFWRGSIVPIVVLLLFQCMGVEGWA